MLRAVAVILALALSPAWAAASAEIVTGHAKSRLLPERAAIAPGTTLWLALDQELQPDWHVYWKNPGDSGLPLDLKWRLPDGFSAGAPLYPLPERILIGPLANFGHKDRATFLIPIAAPAKIDAKEVEIGLEATWLICEEICVPEEGAFALTLPVADSSAPHAEGSEIIESARKALPAHVDATFAAAVEGAVIETKGPTGQFKQALFFPETEGLVEPSAPQEASVRDDKLVIKTKGGFAYDSTKLSSLRGVVVFETAGGARRGYEIDATKDTSAAGISPPQRSGGAAPGGGLLGLIIAAFLGGMILNVMPCVFPVLFIKAAALANGTAATARRDGLLYGAGVVATFLALGSALLALRAGGEALGWGFQLQSPVVVLLSVYVLFMIGLNLAGVFTVGSSLQNVGGAAASGGGPLGAFATGALAVFVAAPCIGPLLSAPMGAAATLPAASGMAIYLALALGFALPFALISLAPPLRRLLPRPGPWMAIFKQVLAFPVFAGAAFFLWVLTEQTGTAGLARALAGALMLAFAAFLFEKSKAGKPLSLARAASVLVAIGGLAASSGLKVVEEARAEGESYGAVDAIPFDEAEIARLNAEGRGVFVDFTAAWCVTCQVNKLTVLSRKSLAATFAERDVTLMSADWTRRDAEITRALAAFGANGVPLYVYYPPEGEARVLAQPLTERAIRDAIQSS